MPRREKEQYFDDGPIESDNLPRIEEQDLRIFKAITTDARLALDFAGNNDPKLFLGDARDVGQAIVDYIKLYKTPPTKRVLLDKFQKNSDLCNKIETVFEEITGFKFNPSEYQYDIEKFKQRYCDVKYSELADGFKFGNNDPDFNLAKAESLFNEIQGVKQKSRNAYTSKSLDEYLPEFHEEYVARLKNPALGQGVLTGYSYLDYITNGMNPAEMMIIGGETGAGKSMFLNNIAIQMWLQRNTIATPTDEYTKGYNVLYFSLEMPFKGCFRRTMSRLADVRMYGLRDSNLSKSEAESVGMASRFIKKYPYKFRIVDIPRGVTVDQIERCYLEAKADFEPDVVVVDYLGLMEDSSSQADDWLKLGHIGGKLHEFGRAYNTRILTAVQLNRPDKKPKDPADLIGMHRIGRSSLIMHHANIGVQIESRPEEWTRDTIRYHVIKNRDGELGCHEITKKFRHAAIFDIPWVPPSTGEYGDFMFGFEDDEDISAQVAKIYGIR